MAQAILTKAQGNPFFLTIPLPVRGGRVRGGDGQASVKALETMGKIGHGFLQKSHQVQRQRGGTDHDPRPRFQRLQEARQKQAHQAKQPRVRGERETLQREQARAQRHLQALEQALEALGLPEAIVEELQWKLKAQAKLLGKIFGLMFPTLFGCHTTAELARVGVSDKNVPASSWVPCPSASG